MKDDGIMIKGNKDGLIAVVNTEKFHDFDSMVEALVEKLQRGKGFYKGFTIKINMDTSNITRREREELRNLLFDEFKIMDCIFENKQDKKNKVFQGIYEGRTKFVRKTVRGGQCVRYVGNVVIVGDVNAGAEVYAGGNIMVLGTVRGHVHAGYSGNEKSIIGAFCMQPEIIQIGSIITRSPEGGEKPPYPEIAKIKDGAIVVEPYILNKYI